MRVWWVLVLAGCNRLLGLDLATEIDAAPPEAPALDAAGGILKPPADAHDCGSPVDFSTWTFDDRAPLPIAPAGAGTYDTSTGPHMFIGYFESMTSRYGIADWDLAAAPMAMPALDLSAGDVLQTVGPSPGGEVVWMTTTVGEVSYATQASAWMRTIADLGFAGVDVATGTVGYRGRTARMMVSVLGTSALVEITSRDGLEWTKLNTVKLTLPSPALSPSLSVDGCTLVYHAGFPSRLYTAYRDASGEFTTNTMLVTPYASVAFGSLLPDNSALWLFGYDASGAPHPVRLHP